MATTPADCGRRCANIVLFWAGEGVRIFRVDNPHTKPLPFWQWMIADVRARYPDVIFLSEAFTRPKMMYRLAKVGFSQSYTYFTWRNTKAELTEYLTELTTTDVKEFFRPQLLRQHARHQSVFPADVRPAGLSHPRGAGRDAVRPLGRVRRLRDLRSRAAAGPRGISRLREVRDPRAGPRTRRATSSTKITMLNRLRRAHPALQTHLGVKFYNAFNDQILLYGKMTPGREDMSSWRSISTRTTCRRRHSSCRCGNGAARPRLARGRGPDPRARVRLDAASSSTCGSIPASCPSRSGDCRRPEGMA